MKLRYTPQAREDLREIKAYTAQALHNPAAAQRLAADVLKRCALLGQQPRMGFALAEKIGRETPLRCLVCGRILAFYSVDENWVSVVRFLDGRTDYLRLLFQ